MPRRAMQLTSVLTAEQTESLRSGQQTWLTEKPSLVHTVHEPVTYRLNGLAMEVHNELGPGHRESVYHDALAAKLAQRDSFDNPHPCASAASSDLLPIR